MAEIIQPIVKSISIKIPGVILACLIGSMLSGCSLFISNAKQEFANNLSATIAGSDDPETIEQAMPAYLVLVSSMIRQDPDNVNLLLSGSKLYSAYASAFVKNKQRQRVLAQHAFDYAEHAVCVQKPDACDAYKESYPKYERSLKQFTKPDAKLLFAFGSAWAGLIEASSSDWNAIADLPRVKAVLKRVVQLDETISDGDAHVYLGVLDSLLPPAMGGKPERAKVHFEKAIEISRGTNLMAKVMYAEKYARLVFNRKLHDQLLHEVVSANITHSSHRLLDVLAQQRAKELLASANDYF